MADQFHPLDRLVADLRLRAELTPEDERSILDLPYTLRTLEAGTYTVREADPPKFCGVIVSGFSFRQKLTGEGLRQIVALNVPGEAVDLQNLFLDVSDHSVQMLTRGEVAHLPRSALRDLTLGSPTIAHAVMVKIQVEASIFREWIVNVGRRDARARAAHLLCELAVRLEAAGLTAEYEYQLPMTQEHLADALGLTAVHVNRTLKSLEADGYISRTKRTIRFPNWEAMHHVADFNERYLHIEKWRAKRGGGASLK